MKRFCFALLFSLFCCNLVSAQVVIDKSHRIQNTKKPEPGYCAWACLETLGNHNGVDVLKGLMEKRKKESDYSYWDGQKWVAEPYVAVDVGGMILKTKRNVGTAWAIYRKLKSLKVKLYCQPDGDYDTTLIRQCVKLKIGCSVAMRENAFFEGSEAHAIIITNFGDKEVEILDPNHPNEIKKKSRAWFDTYWSGYTVAVTK